MKNSEQIRRTSKFLRLVCFMGLLAAPIVTGAYWIVNGFPFFPFREMRWVIHLSKPPFASHPILFTPISQLSPFLKFAGFLVDLIPCTFVILVLYFLMRLFKLYERLEFFSKSNVRYIRALGLIIFIGQLATPLYGALLSLILTISNPPDQRIILISYGPAELKMMALSFLILFAARIMEEGRHLQEESSGII